MNLSTNPFFTHGIGKMCTICHVIFKGTDSTRSIFSTLEELESPMNVLQVLQTFSNFRSYNDPQIKMLCTTCYGKTIEVYKFIQMCNKASENIQNYLKNVEAIKTIKEETDVALKVEEISIGPTRIIIDGREFVEEMENEKTQKLGELGMLISDTDIKVEERIRIPKEGIEQETSNTEEIDIFHTEIITEGNTSSSDVKVEEISIASSKITIDGREFVDEKISKLDELGMVISATEIKTEEIILQEEMEKETSNNEEITISHPEVVTEENIESSDFDNLRVEKIDGEMHDERVGRNKLKHCHLVFSDKRDLDDHRKEAKRIKNKPLLSELCNPSFGTKCNLRSHDQRQNSQRAHISNDSRIKQDRHQPLKDHETDVVCLECQQVFYNDKKLKIHMMRSHKKKLNTPVQVHPGETPFTCLICKCGFAAASSLRRHMAIHNGVKAHKCEQCDRRFTQASDLRRHMDIHNGVKAHKCEQCDRRFTQGSDLRRHMDIHNGVKAHKCELCDRRFTQASDLRRHMDIHNGVKAHKCEQCDWRFTRAANLRTHMERHNGVKAHKCEQCDRRFTHASDLRRHMDIHNGVKAHKCEQCDWRFTRAAHLSRHMDKIHRSYAGA